MHTKDLDLNAIRQWILKAKTDIARITERIAQTPDDHIGEPPVDPDWEVPEVST